MQGFILNKKTFSEKAAINKAESLGKNATEQDKKNLESTLPKMNRSIVHKVWDKVQFLYDAYKKANLPAKLQISVIGALLYLVLPIDVLPDLIPFVGFFDDVAVILFIYKQVAEYMVPKLVDKKVQEIEESLYSRFNTKLNDIFRKNLWRSIIVLILNLIGFVLLIFKPLEISLSRMTAMAAFFIAFVLFLASVVNNCQKYGAITIYNLKIVLKEKNLKKGVGKAVTKKYPEIAKVYAKVDVARHFVPGLDTVPQLDEIIDDFVQHYKKSAILASSLIVVYSVTFFVVRFFLLKQ